MNYIRIYWSIIHNRLHNKVDGYVEHHHIIPLSEGGPDNNDNIVALTAREHYICHLLLAKIYDDYKMLSAVVWMRVARERWQSRSFKFNNRLYELVRKAFAKKISNSAKERYKDKTKHPMYGKKQSNESKRKNSESHKGRAPWNKGKKCGNISDAQKAKLSAAVSGEKNAMYGSKYKWVNDGVRNYRWPLDKTLPDNMKFGQIRNKKNAGN